MHANMRGRSRYPSRSQASTGNKRDGRDRRQRDKTESQNDYSKEADHRENCLGCDQDEGTESGGDAFSPAKFQPDGKHVADDREERGNPH